MPFLIRPFRRFPVQCALPTTLVHSKANAPYGISRVQGGESWETFDKITHG